MDDRITDVRSIATNLILKIFSKPGGTVRKLSDIDRMLIALNCIFGHFADINLPIVDSGDTGPIQQSDKVDLIS